MSLTLSYSCGKMGPKNLVNYFQVGYIEHFTNENYFFL